MENGYSSPTSTGTPFFFSVIVIMQHIINFAWEKTNLISFAENWINKENSRCTAVFSIFPFGNHVKNLVKILIKNPAFCLKQTYLWPIQCIDSSLMSVTTSFGHKDFTIIPGNASNKYKIMPKWGIFNASVLLNEHAWAPTI